MASLKIKENVYYVGAIHWDRRLFDELIPLPEGTTYNSYIIKGSEKTAIIDAVDPATNSILFNNLHSLKISKIDYIISNHAEQDHSGAIVDLLELYPESKVVTNAKCKEFLKDLLHITDDSFIVVNDGDKLSLGDKTLTFLLTPWVHWPETMVTYLNEDKLLFSCDFFGAHYSFSLPFVEDYNKEEILSCAKRYYGEIMMPFRSQIKKNIEKVEKLAIDYICPSHGPIYNDPKFIIEAYKEWISDNVSKKILIPYISMHDSTKVMVEYLEDILIEKGTNKGIKVKPFNLTHTDIGELVVELVDASTVIIASPTVLAGVHPVVAHAIFLINALRPKTKFVGIVGSYGWGGKMVEQITGLLTNIKPEILEPVMIKGLPKPEDFELLNKLADTIIEKNSF